MWPISPLHSEQLLQGGKLPEPSKYWEDLGLILYSLNSTNAKEGVALHDSIVQHQTALNLSTNDLPYLIVHPGLEKDASMPHGVKPVILPGVTRVYTSAILKQTCSNHKFEYGLDNGVPEQSNIGNGTRTLYMPSGAVNESGLRVLIRNGVLFLDARNTYLTNSYAVGRVNFARQGDAPR
jgi:hypothetical protein